ncbi:High mobility group box domain protein [Raphanus sativus]|nr:High mobility group box domain protein [Raphanus sativus]
MPVTLKCCSFGCRRSGVCVCGNDFRSKLVRFIDAALLSFVCLSLSCKVNNTDADAKIRVNLRECLIVSRRRKAKRVRKAKDEKKSSASNNKPKRPLTAFFIFMNDFRKTFKEENPSSNVKDEKKVYLDKAAELKAEYNKSLESSDADEELI